MFNNILLTPLVFPYQYLCENLCNVWSMWNFCFKTSNQVKFSKYVALPPLWLSFWKPEVYARNPTVFWGKLRQASFHFSLCYLVLRERRNLNCSVLKADCVFTLSSNQNLIKKLVATSCKIFSHEISSLKLPSINGCENSLIYLFIYFSGAVIK